METVKAGLIIKLCLAEHEGRERMFAEFPRHATVIAAIKQIPGRWSQSKKRWHLAPTNKIYALLKERIKGLAVLDDAELRKQVRAKKPAIAVPQLMLRSCATSVTALAPLNHTFRCLPIL